MEGWAKAAVLPNSASGITTAYFITLTSNRQHGNQSELQLSGASSVHALFKAGVGPCGGIPPILREGDAKRDYEIRSGRRPADGAWPEWRGGGGNTANLARGSRPCVGGHAGGSVRVSVCVRG